MQELKDTQNERDDRCLPIDRVGVKGLRFPVEVRDKGGSVQRTVATVSLAVDLPAHFKGTHMSRFVEALHAHGGCLDVHSILALPRELLRLLDACKSHVEIQFPFFLSKPAPVSGIAGLVDYEVRIEVEATATGADAAATIAATAGRAAIDASAGLGALGRSVTQAAVSAMPPSTSSAPSTPSRGREAPALATARTSPTSGWLRLPASLRCSKSCNILLIRLIVDSPIQRQPDSCLKEPAEEPAA